MDGSSAVVTAAALEDSGEIGIEALLRYVSGVVDEIESFKAERQAEATRAARARLTVIYADKRFQKHRTA